MSQIKNLLGAYMIVGFLLGIYGVVEYTVATWRHPSVLWIGILFGLVYIAIGVSGYFLIRTGKYSWSTIILQVIQSAGFCALGFKYVFCAGTSFKFGYRSPNVYYLLEPINVEFSFGITSDAGFFFINFAPLLVIFLLNKYCSMSVKDEVI